MKLSGNIEKDHEYLVLLAVADSAIDSAMAEVAETSSQEKADKIYSLRRSLCKELVNQAKDHYNAQVNKKTGKYKEGSSLSRVKDATQFRNWHHTFMRHWLASILVKTYGFSVNEVLTLASGRTFQ